MVMIMYDGDDNLYQKIPTKRSEKTQVSDIFLEIYK